MSKYSFSGVNGHLLCVNWVSWVTEGLLPVVGHHASHSGTTPAADDAVLYDMTFTSAAGHSRSTGRPVTERDAAANACRASCNYK